MPRLIRLTVFYDLTHCREDDSIRRLGEDIGKLLACDTVAHLTPLLRTLLTVMYSNGAPSGVGFVAHVFYITLKQALQLSEMRPQDMKDFTAEVLKDESDNSHWSEPVAKEALRRIWTRDDEGVSNLLRQMIDAQSQRSGLAIVTSTGLAMLIALCKGYLQERECRPHTESLV